MVPITSSQLVISSKSREQILGWLITEGFGVFGTAKWLETGGNRWKK